MILGKRSDFKRRKNDLYTTWDPRAVTPLLPYLNPKTRYCEPCAGDGALIKQLKPHGHVCARARDIDPKADGIEKKDALTLLTGNIDCFITNPPWTREILHPLINHLRVQAPTWLLFDADWAHTIHKNMAKRNSCKTTPELLKYCSKIVSVGRVKWIKDSPHDAKDNCAWYLFGDKETKTEFIGR